MSAYKIIEVIKTSEKETQSIYDADNILNAEIKMHNDFGVAVKQDTTLATYVTVIDNTDGSRINGRYYAKKVDFKPGDEPVDLSIKQRVYTHNNYAEDNITSYESEQLAIGNFHTKLAAQRNNASCNFALTIRLDGQGDYAEFDNWRRDEE